MHQHNGMNNIISNSKCFKWVWTAGK